MSMTKKQILNLDKFTAENPKIQTIHVSVNLVYRGNFNDERLIDSQQFQVNELIDKPLVWFDLYLGKYAKNSIKIAFAYLKNRDLYFLEDNGKEVNVIKKDTFSHYYSDDYDEKYIISTQIW